ncbi:hypothetical protein AcV5_006780 [Taiwanofungus camphoratus]|nr:hypothetical protein AcV5_006780 [Antrodia cinnamomea]
MNQSTSDTKEPVVAVFHDRATFACSQCSAVVALQDELISKSFSGRDGRGYLMHSAVNVRMGKKEDRPLLYVVSYPSIATLTMKSCAGREFIQ